LVPKICSHHGVDRATNFRYKRRPASAGFALIQDWSTMKNVEMTVDGTTLTIKVDLSKEFGPSASGKTIIIASTEGNVSVPGRQEKIGLNVYRKK
jgi:hypothetical protein